MRYKLFLCFSILLLNITSSISRNTNILVKPKSRAASSAAINGLKNSVASGLAAACSKTALAPFDTIKTVQQQARVGGGQALGLLEAAKVILSRPRGFMELYAGLGVAVVGAMPSVGLYFGVYSYSKEKIQPFLQKKIGNAKSSEATVSTLSVAAAAAIGNTVASFSRVPYEVVKQKLQTGEYSSTFVAITDMFQTQGLRAFFPVGGVSIQMIRDIPYAIVTLMTYECLREHWVNKHEKAAWRDMTTGAIAGGVGSYVTNPMDVIKTRLQVDSGLYSGSVWACTKATYAEGGASAFLRGSVPRLCHKIPANAMFFVWYEFFRRILRVNDSRTEEK